MEPQQPMPTRKDSRPTLLRPQWRTAGIDWYRYVVEEPEHVRRGLEIAKELQAEDEAKGLKKWGWSLPPYHGEGTERVRWGLWRGRLLWETSGRWAPHTWTRLPSCGGRATRVDLQMTLRLSRPHLALWERLAPREATTHPFRLPSGTPCRVEQGANGLGVFRVAPRDDPEHGRCYDKGAEQGSDVEGHRWRVEWELKYDQAERIACQHLQDMKNPEWCGSYVASRWLSRVGLWPFSRDVEERARLRGEPEPVATVDKLRDWMQSSVAPVVQRLLKVAPPEDVLEWLGLDHVAEPRRPLDDHLGEVPTA